jgi:hypothetical protein
MIFISGTITVLNKNMDKDLKFLQTEIFISESTKMISLKNMANIIGQVEPTIEAISCQAWDTEKENGIWFMEIFMKVSTWMIRKMVRGHIYGKMVPNM